MNRPFVARAGKIITGAAKARTIMLAYYAGIATGCFIMVAWAYTLAFATPQAIALLEWVQG